MNGMDYKKIVISVITPLYKGTQYLNSIVAQVECAASVIDAKVELIIVNDFPGDENKIFVKSDFLSIQVIDDGTNRGIHGARVKGLENANGEYILFLDQDDYINKEYFKSQLNIIGDNDISVCNCIHEKSLFYNEWLVFEEVVNYKCMLNRGNTIVSPGQCLIRKNAIPWEWTNYIMHVNCADDYYLWILLFNRTNKIVLNKDILFEHVVNGNNYSMDFVKLQRSENEMLDLIKNNRLIGNEDISQLSKCLSRNHTNRIAYLQRYRRLFIVLRDLVISNNQNSFAKRLKGIGINTVAIYGAGEIGRILREFLKEINVKCYIDIDYKNKLEDIPVYPLESSYLDVDAVIVSLTAGEEQVVDAIRSIYEKNIFTVFDLIEDK